MSGSKAPSNEEEEYFAKLEREKREKLRETMEAEQARVAAEELRRLHWLRCAKCGNLMDSHQFRGVVIEKCPVCHGVYLDAGELEKLAGSDRGGMVDSVVQFFGLSRHRKVGEPPSEEGR